MQLSSHAPGARCRDFIGTSGFAQAVRIKRCGFPSHWTSRCWTVERLQAKAGSRPLYEKILQRQLCLFRRISLGQAPHSVLAKPLTLSWLQTTKDLKMSAPGGAELCTFCRIRLHSSKLLFFFYERYQPLTPAQGNDTVVLRWWCLVRTSGVKGHNIYILV